MRSQGLSLMRRAGCAGCRARRDRRHRLRRTRAHRRHEAEPRRLLHPPRGLREAHPRVPEDGGREGRRASPSRTALRASRRARSRQVSSSTSSRCRSLRTSTSSSLPELVDAKWKKQSYKGMVTNSVVVFVVRDGNPKKIKSWNDLLRPDVEVVTPNPFTSGGARWNIMAAYGAWRKVGQDRQAGAGEPAQALEERHRPGHERTRLAEHVQQRQGRRAPRLRERGVLLAHAGPEPPVGHPEGDDPHREPDRRHQVEP